MSLLQQIQDATIATDQPLAAVLRQTMVLAVRLDNQLLRQWTYEELNGYTDEATLPPYRRSRPVNVLGDFFVFERHVSDEMHTRVDPTEIQLKDVPITRDMVGDSQDRQRLFRHAFLKPVAVYEDWLRNQTGDKEVRWSAEDFARYRSNLIRGSTCLAAWQVLSREDLIGVVDGVRNRLIEFALELEQQAPDAGEVPASSVSLSGEQVTAIATKIIYANSYVEAINMNDNSINVGGSAANIVGGQNNVAQQGDATITQHGADLAPLFGALRAAVEQLEGHLPSDQASTTRELVQELEAEAATPKPAPGRMVGTLKRITAIAGAAGGAGAAVIDAAQAIQRALGG